MKKLVWLRVFNVFLFCVLTLSGTADVLDGTLSGNLLRDEKFHTACISLNLAQYEDVSNPALKKAILGAQLGESGVCFPVLQGLGGVEIVFRFRLSGTIGRDKRDAAQRITRLKLVIGPMELYGRRLDAEVQSPESNLMQKSARRSDVFEFRLRSDDPRLVPQMAPMYLMADYDGNENDRTKALIWTIATHVAKGQFESGIAIPVVPYPRKIEASYQWIYSTVQEFASLFFKGAGGHSGGFVPLYTVDTPDEYVNLYEVERAKRALTEQAARHQEVLDAAKQMLAGAQQPAETKKSEPPVDQKPFEILPVTEGAKSFTIKANKPLTVRLATVGGEKALRQTEKNVPFGDLVNSMDLPLKPGETKELPLAPDKVYVAVFWKVDDLTVRHDIDLRKVVKDEVKK